MKRNYVIAVSLIVSQSVIYGLGDPISKAAFESVPLFVLLTLRYSLSFLLMILIFVRTIAAGLRRSSVRDWIGPAIFIGAAYVSNNVGLLLTQATTVAFIRSLPTIIAPVIAFILIRRRYRAALIPLQALVILGSYLITSEKGGLGSGFGLGEVFALLSAVLIALSLVTTERSLKNIDAITLSALQAGASALMAAIGMIAFYYIDSLSAITNSGSAAPGDAAARAGSSLISYLSNEIGSISPPIWVIILYLAFLCTVGGYVLQNLALRDIKAHTVAMLQCLCPVMTAVFSYFILGETMSLTGFTGAVIILVCLLLGVRYDRAVDEQTDADKKTADEMSASSRRR